MRYSLVNRKDGVGRDSVPTLPEVAAPSRSGTRRAVRPEQEFQMQLEVEAVQESLRAEREKEERELAAIDEMLRPFVEGIDEEEEPTRVRKVVVELKRRLGLPPSCRPRRTGG